MEYMFNKLIANSEVVIEFVVVVDLAFVKAE